MESIDNIFVLSYLTTFNFFFFSQTFFKNHNPHSSSSSSSISLEIELGSHICFILIFLFLESHAHKPEKVGEKEEDFGMS